MSEQITIEKFNPKKQELVELANKYNALTIAGIDDKEGYTLVDQARKDLKRTRVELQKTGKSLREEAVAFQKRVIAVEKELVEIIDPVETRLEEEQKRIDKLKILEKRKADLPDRKEKLGQVECIVEDKFLLLMDDAQFNNFFLQKKEEYLNKKAEALRLEREEAERKAAIDRAVKEAEAKAKAEAERQAQLEKIRLENERKRLEQEKIEAEQRAKRAAELAEQERLKLEIEKAEAIELAKLKHEQEMREAEEKAKREAEEKERKRLEAERIQKEAELKKQKEEKISQWLAENGFDNSEKFIIKHENGIIKLYELKSIYDGDK